MKHLIFVLMIFLCIPSFAHINATEFQAEKQDSARGTLRFKDGDTIKGELISSTETAGIFFSERFGEIQFTVEEATFEPEQLIAKQDKNRNESKQGGSIEINEISGVNSAQSVALQILKPDTWSIGGGLEYEKGQENDEFKFNVDLRGKWKRTKNEVNIDARSELKILNSDKTADTQRFRGNWIYLLPYNLFSEVNGYLERDTVAVDETVFDYMLNQVGAGLGYNFIWGEKSSTKVSLLHNRLRLNFLDQNDHAYTSATSIAIANQLQLTKTFSIEQWIHIYFWQDGSQGYDGEADFKYDIDKNLSLILRYTYRDNAFTLDDNFRNRLKLLLRYHF